MYKIKMARLVRGLKQGDAARAAGITQSRLSAIENGRVWASPIEKARIAHFYRTPVRAIFSDLDKHEAVVTAGAL